MTQELIQIIVPIIALFINVPVVMFFVGRMVKKRDATEEDINKTLKEIATQLGGFDKRLALIEKDIERQKGMEEKMDGIMFKSTKLGKDMDACFKMIRQQKEELKQTEDTLKNRTHFTINSIQKIISVLYRLHADDPEKREMAEVDIGDIPN